MEDYWKLSRLYIAQDLTPGTVTLLSPEQTHYLKNVLRRQPGDQVRLFNGRDGEYLAEITELGKKDGKASLKNQIKPQPVPKPAVHLLFAPIKKHRMDFLIEKAVELGATDLHPVITHRTVIKEVNEERLRVQILEAAEQCERFEIPRLHASAKLPTKIAGWKNGTILWCNERGQNASLTAQKTAHRNFLVGPEGGFDDQETAFLSQTPHVTAISLGETVYRAETAAILCLVKALISP